MQEKFTNILCKKGNITLYLSEEIELRKYKKFERQI